MDELPAENEIGSGHVESAGRENERLDILRRLLIAPEQDKLTEAENRISRLENREIDVTSDQIAQLLPEAVVSRSRKDGKLASALGPTVEETIRTSVKRDPQPIVDAIFPVIGPAIRRAIAEALSTTLESVNRTMEHQFSLQGLRWRFEALRTGQKFSDVVLRNTLLYAVEQIFVVHNETGLPLAHVSREDQDVQDGALVSSMLTVIQDFVRDSLGGESGDSLESIEYGDLTIVIAPGPLATLAAVIRGNPPRSVREDMQELIEDFHLAYNAEVEAYSGDASVFDKARPLLASGLAVQVHRSEGVSWATWLVLLVIVGAIALAAFLLIRSNARWTAFVSDVDEIPGIVVTETSRSAGVRTVRGLRDPLAADPAGQLATHGYDSTDVRFDFEAYRALTPAIISLRAARALDLPQTARLHFDHGTLYASGSAHRPWIEEARIRAAQLEEVDAYDDAALVDEDEKAILDISDRIMRMPVLFDTGSTDVSPSSVDSLIALAGEGLRVAADAGIPATIVLRGFASADGNVDLNRRLQRARSAAVRAAFVQSGVPATAIVEEEGGIANPEVRAILRILDRPTGAPEQ
ncbi:MAG: hypothetical protein KDD65_03605 [Bacteroidetes bacterium]|nr:hypothetical protein [Bacteroidota bacterium]